MNKWQGFVIGLGKIGQGYDYSDSESKRILTHANAFSTHPKFSLSGGFDPDASAREKFEKKFKVSAFADLDSTLEKIKPDVIAIASPTEFHMSHRISAVKSRPRLIICEKPLAYHLEEAEQIVSLAKENSIPLAVNYMRRFDPGVLAIRQRLKAGELGEVYKAVFHYSKGIYNNASHFVDLLQFLFGDASGVSIVHAGRRWQDRDPEPDFVVQIGSLSAFFLAGREENYSQAEGEIWGTKGKILYKAGGEKIEWLRAIPDPRFPGYFDLEPKAEIIPSGLEQQQWHVLDNLAHFLAGESKEYYSSGESALNTLRTIARMVNYG
jgi:predicted dehydrogenase